MGIIENINKIRPYTMVPVERCHTIVRTVQDVNEQLIEGDLIECGIWKCGLLGLMSLTNKEYENKRSVHGFDSFQCDVPNSFVTFEEVQECLRDMDAEECILHEGYFKDTFPLVREKIQKIAVLRIDVCWNSVITECLEEFYDKVSPGGYIIIDDYGHYEESKVAVDSFRESRNINDEIIHTDYTEVWWEKL